MHDRFSQDAQLSRGAQLREYAETTAPAPRDRRTTSIPTRTEELTDQLASLTKQARGYAETQAEAAEVGGWWNTEPVTDAAASPIMRPGQGREAAVLMLFCTGGASLETGQAGGPYLLLTRRSSGLAKHPGQISFPGGAREDFDVDSASTALRESQEEIGLEVDRVTVIGALPPAPIPISGFMVTPVIAVAGDPGVLTPQLGEVDHVLRVPVADLIRPARRRSSALRRGGITIKGPAFLIGDTLIWGFTGILLDRVLDRLHWAEPWDWDRQIDPQDYLRLD